MLYLLLFSYLSPVLDYPPCAKCQCLSLSTRTLRTDTLARLDRHEVSCITGFFRGPCAAYGLFVETNSPPSFS